MRGIRLVAIMTVAAALVAACGSSRPSNTSSHTTTARRRSTSTTETSSSQQLANLVASVQNGVIRIESTGCGVLSTGTGFLISPRLVATVEHVVDGAVSIRLVRAGHTLGTGTVIGEDATRDVALVRSSKPISGPLFHIATRSPRLGEAVAVLGFPLGLPLTVTQGDVSGLDRTIPIVGIERTNLVQTDAAINPGNSGGPLISLQDGDVIGLIDLGTDQANGIGFAVSADVAAPLLDAWKVAPQPVPAASCQSETQTATSSGTATTPTTSTPTSTTPAPTLDTYSGHAFSIEYPTGWTIVTAEKQQSYGTDTTIQDPSESTALIRVDVSKNPPTTNLRALARQEIAALAKEPGYRLLHLGPSTIDGFASLDWRFDVDQAGVLLEKDDVFFVDSKANEGVAALTQAPADVYPSVSSAFAALRQTLVMN